MNILKKIFKDERTKTKTAYEIFMILLATLSVATIWKSIAYDTFLVWFTWAIFFMDFVYRFWNSEKKWEFIKSNPFIVIAAIPLDAVFQFARFARILHLLRLKSITKYYTMPFIKYLKRQHLLLVASATAVIVFLAIIPLYQLEEDLESYWEALISALSTLTFFGHSQFEPSTPIGSFIIVVLTIFGVVLHGLVISTAIDVIYHTKFVQSLKNKLKSSR
ncbi:hypothetical protein [Thalassobacillus hwangdonensis]|uniref:Voltage-gated potassium channel n=1 Tax=Thalassobacillus hwangdonensis TaxID=546108 RepID=A0ABW3L4V1_9BACI